MAINLPQMAVPRVTRPRLPMRLPEGAKAPGFQIAAGMAAILAGLLGAVPFFKDFDIADNNAKIAYMVSITAAVIGGALTLVRFAIGPPLASGGVALLAGAGVSLAVTRIDVPSAFSTTDSKLIAAAATLGLIAVALCSSLFLGKATSALGGVIAVLALVTVGCTAALIHIDDSHGVVQVGLIGGSLVVAIIVMIGGLKGHWGAISSIVAAGAQVPDWLDLALHRDDRNAAAVAGLISVLGVVALAAIVIVVAATSSENGYDAGPKHAVVSSIVHPMVQPQWVREGSLEPRVGPVLLPVGGGATGVTQLGGGSGGVTGAVATVAAAAQWAADPYHRYELRYFDGSGWTEHVVSGGVAEVDPTG